MTELAHILVVDDDPIIRRMFRLLLNDTGYRVSTATSGEEALAYMELVTPDLVLMDLMLPGINGQEVTGRVKGDIARAGPRRRRLSDKAGRIRRAAGARARNAAAPA